MNPRIFLIAFTCLLAISAIGISQTGSDFNKTDPQGRKQGHWIKKNEEVIIYDGFFKDDHPVGEFRRYNEDNTLKSLLIYSNDGKEADATIYHSNGFISSKGKYINQKKEGKWQFYSAYIENYLINEEEYSRNLKNGVSVKFYPDGTVAERFIYLNEIKQGEWTQYYKNGDLCLKSYYLNGKVNGKFEVWYENGKIELSGAYKNNIREGRWLIYNEDGTLKYDLEYVAGVTKNRQLDIDESDFIDSLEKNAGKISDPEKTGEIW